jgi:hypothetical protein
MVLRRREHREFEMARLPGRVAGHLLLRRFGFRHSMTGMNAEDLLAFVVGESGALLAIINLTLG